MIAAQLLAYYFTELKDDQVKKVSFIICFNQCCSYASSFALASVCELFEAYDNR